MQSLFDGSLNVFKHQLNHEPSWFDNAVQKYAKKVGTIEEAPKIQQLHLMHFEIGKW